MLVSQAIAHVFCYDAGCLTCLIGGSISRIAENYFTNLHTYSKLFVHLNPDRGRKLGRPAETGQVALDQGRLRW